MHKTIQDAIKKGELTDADLKDRTLWIHISNPRGVCEGCTGGLFNDGRTDGILQQFSTLQVDGKSPYIGLRILVTAEGGKAITGQRDGRGVILDVLQVRNGRVVPR